MKTNIITTIGGFFAIFLANGIAYGAIFADKVAEVLQRLPEGMTQESLPMIMVGHFIQTLLLVGLFVTLIAIPCLMAVATASGPGLP